MKKRDLDLLSRMFKPVKNVDFDKVGVALGMNM